MKKKKTILITGATAGIGRVTALHLARRGHTVFAAGRNPGSLKSLEKEAKGLPLRVLSLDVNEAASIEAAKKLIDEETEGRGVDVLVNNAGFGILAPLEMMDVADVRRQFETNVFGLFAVTKAFLPAMRERGAGRLVNVSSVGGRMTLPFFGAYNATKHALESMSDALRYELAPFGIDVVLIEPGIIRTEFTPRAMDELGKYKSPDSPYAPVIARADELRVQAEKTAVGPECVARAIEVAVESRRPRARYVTPFRARIMLALVALLPTRWMDGILRAVAGLTRRRLSRKSSDPTVRPDRALAT